jgi:hypothetical protein
VGQVGFLKQFRRDKLASELEAIRIQALRAIHDDSIEEKICKLLFGKNASHGMIPRASGHSSASDARSIHLFIEQGPRA